MSLRSDLFAALRVAAGLTVALLLGMAMVFATLLLGGPS
jgi:hypothetical protein